MVWLLVALLLAGVPLWLALPGAPVLIALADLGFATLASSPLFPEFFGIALASPRAPPLPAV